MIHLYDFDMDYAEFIASRLKELRTKKGVSARDMSLSIGQSPGYIHKIESRQNLPSMIGFFYICEYLNISPREFFDENIEYSDRAWKLFKKLMELNEQELGVVESLLETWQRE